MAARDVFKGVEDKNEGGNFQHPKRQHRHRVGQQKLQQGGHDQGDQKQPERQPVRRQHEIIPQAKDQQPDRQRRHGDISQPAGNVEAKPEIQVIHRLEQELADVAVLDVGGDLPVVLVHGGERVGDGHDEVIRSHLRQREGGDGGIRAFARKDGSPEIDHRQQRDEAEQGAREKIEPVGQMVLKPDVDGVPVFVHPVLFSPP